MNLGLPHVCGHNDSLPTDVVRVADAAAHRGEGGEGCGFDEGRGGVQGFGRAKMLEKVSKLSIEKTDFCCCKHR